MCKVGLGNSGWVVQHCKKSISFFSALGGGENSSKMLSNQWSCILKVMSNDDDNRLGIIIIKWILCLL